MSARLDRIEARLAALEARDADTSVTSILGWLLRRGAAAPSTDGSSGMLTYGGSVHRPGADDPILWQRNHDVAAVRGADPDRLAAPLAALGHPDRIRLLRVALDAGPVRTADLGAALPGTSAGRLYHHLHELEAGGWLRGIARGLWEVPVPRVVPALTALAIAADVGETDAED